MKRSCLAAIVTTALAATLAFSGTVNALGPNDSARQRYINQGKAQGHCKFFANTIVGEQYQRYGASGVTTSAQEVYATCMSLVSFYGSSVDLPSKSKIMSALHD